MFEPRLRTYLVALAALAASTARGASTVEEESYCDVAMYPADSGEPETYVGFVLVDPDEECPAPEDVQRLKEDCPCPGHRLLEACAPAGERMVRKGGGGGGCMGAVGVGKKMKECSYDAAGVATGVCCGRPLVRDDGRAVLAVVAGTGGWRRDAAVDGSALSEDDRAAAVAWWLEAARMEHASVASFARATLELMALGAPPDLLRDTQQAAIDEVDHAERCFGLASALAGEVHGPGPLPVDGLDVRVDPVAVAVAVALEGCVGETLAAVDARARLLGATDPAVRATLARIVEDESSHAALAWRTLAWLLEAHGAPVRDAVDAVFAAAPVPSAATRAVPSHGVIAPLLRDRLLLDAWRTLVQPAWAELRASVDGP